MLTANTTVQSREVVAPICDWLTQVLSWKLGATIQRSDVYEAYVRECNAHGIEPTTNAAFGKLVRLVFPKVGSTRLGQRGKNKMHYVNLEWACRLRPEERLGRSTVEGPGLVWIEENPNSSRNRRPACTSPALSARTKRRPKPKGVDENDSNKQAESLADHVARRATTPQTSTAVTSFSAEGSSIVAPNNNPATVGRWAGPGEDGRDHTRILNQAQALAQALRRRQRGLEVLARQGLNKRKSQEEEERRGPNIQQVTMREVSGNRQLWTPSPWELHQFRLLERDGWIAGAHLSNGLKISHYIETYDREMAEIVPLNPQCTDQTELMRVLTTSDDTTLSLRARLDALTSYTLLTMSSFLDGDIEVGREFFHKARDALSDVFDVTEYDVAAALVAMAWWARFYAESFEEGVHKQIYYSTLGISTCEALGAINDSAYSGFLLFLSQHGMQSPINRIEKAKRAQPYARQWVAKAKKPAKQQSPLLFELCAVHGDVLHHWHTFYPVGCGDAPSAGRRLGPGDSAGVLPLLLEHLEHVADIFRRLPPECNSSGSTLPAQSYNLIKSLGLGTRVLIFMLLGEPQQLQAAKELVRHLVSIPHQMRIICLHEMASNDYLIPRNVVNILEFWGEAGVLQAFFRALEGFRAKFYWMRKVCTFVSQALNRLDTANSPPGGQLLAASSPWATTPHLEPELGPFHQSNHPTTQVVDPPHVETFSGRGSDEASIADLSPSFADGDEGAPRGPALPCSPLAVTPMEATQLPRGVIASEEDLSSDECGVPLPPLFDDLVDGSLGSASYYSTSSPAGSFDSSAGPDSPCHLPDTDSLDLTTWCPP